MAGVPESVLEEIHSLLGNDKEVSAYVLMPALRYARDRSAGIESLDVYHYKHPRSDCLPLPRPPLPPQVQTFTPEELSTTEVPFQLRCAGVHADLSIDPDESSLGFDDPSATNMPMSVSLSAGLTPRAKPRAVGLPSR